MRVVLADVASGLLTPGDQLPSDADLARQFGVSRGVARECVRGLEERGVVTVKHGRGATVTSPSEWDPFSPDVLTALLGSEHGKRILEEYLECRRILEVEAVSLAAVRATEADLTALSDALARMTTSAQRATVNPAAEELYHRADIDFHRAVIRATGNRALGHMTEPIHTALAMARRPLARPSQRLARSIPEHERILQAVAGGDPEGAREAMTDHLRTVESYLDEYDDDRQTQSRSG